MHHTKYYDGETHSSPVSHMLRDAIGSSRRKVRKPDDKGMEARHFREFEQQRQRMFEPQYVPSMIQGLQNQEQNQEEIFERQTMFDVMQQTYTMHRFRTLLLPYFETVKSDFITSNNLRALDMVDPKQYQQIMRDFKKFLVLKRNGKGKGKGKRKRDENRNQSEAHDGQTDIHDISNNSRYG
jgi:hypothetical protein